MEYLSELKEPVIYYCLIFNHKIDFADDNDEIFFKLSYGLMCNEHKYEIKLLTLLVVSLLTRQLYE